MKDVTVHTITWNEEYLLPYFIKHYYPFARKIVVHDNESTDNTADIALSYEDVFVETYQSNGEQDNFTMVNVKNTCWKNDDTKWSIVCDVDELLLIDWEKIESYSTPVAFQATGWQMMGRDEPFEEINRAFRTDKFNKIVLFSSNVEKIDYEPGCHIAHPSCPVVCETELLHYNSLGENYVVERYKRYAERMSYSDKRHGYGKHYQRPDNYTRRRYRQLYRLSQKVRSLKEIYEGSYHSILHSESDP
jgi:glycosyltransferase involved in cell wall biosynthesis